MSKNIPHIFSRIVILSALMACLWSMTAYASTGWQRDDTGWWYNNQDGSYENSGWFKDDSGRWFYAGSDGYILTSAYTPDGYLVDKDGVWIENYTMYDGCYSFSANHMDGYELLHDYVSTSEHNGETLFEWPSDKTKLPQNIVSHLKDESDSSICVTSNLNGEPEFYLIAHTDTGDEVSYEEGYEKKAEGYYEYYWSSDVPDLWAKGCILMTKDMLYLHGFSWTSFTDQVYTKRK